MDMQELEEMLAVVDWAGIPSFGYPLDEAIRGIIFLKAPETSSEEVQSCLVYDRRKLRECLLEQNPEWTDEEAEEWIDYNLDVASKGFRPVIIDFQEEGVL